MLLTSTRYQLIYIVSHHVTSLQASTVRYSFSIVTFEPEYQKDKQFLYELLFNWLHVRIKKSTDQKFATLYISMFVILAYF